VQVDQTGKPKVSGHCDSALTCKEFLGLHG
jgi:hypothetical protein